MEPFTLELVASLAGHLDRVWSVAWSPKGDMLASCSGDKTVRVWTRRGVQGTANAAGPGQQRTTAESTQQWVCSAILDQCHTRTIRTVAWSPSGRSLATASFDATVAIWELSGGIWEQVAELEGHENEVKCVAWNPDGRLIATCGRDRSVWIWESMPGREFECVDVKQAHSQDVKVVRWHPGGELLVSAGYDDSIKLWTYDGDEWGCSQTLGGASSPFPGHTSTVWDVAWDPAGQRLASCSDDRTVRVWEARAAAAGTATGAPVAGREGDATASPAGPSPSGCFVPSHPNLRCGATLSGYHVRTIFSLDWGPAGLIATGDGEDCISVFGQGDPELARLELRRYQQRKEQGAAGPRAIAPEAGWDMARGIGCLAQSGDTSMTGTEHFGAAAGAAGSGREGLQLSCAGGGPWGRWAMVRGAHSADVNCVRWHPLEHRLLASCGDDGLVRLWRLRE